MFMKVFLRVRKVFTDAKIMLARSQSYIAIANAGMILFLFLGDFGVELDLQRWFVPIFIGSMLVMLFVGFLDDRLGFFTEEQKLKSDKNPYFVKIMREVRKVNARLDELEKKQ